jgi:hypothetical protein
MKLATCILSYFALPLIALASVTSRLEVTPTAPRVTEVSFQKESLVAVKVYASDIVFALLLDGTLRNEIRVQPQEREYLDKVIHGSKLIWDISPDVESDVKTKMLILLLTELEDEAIKEVCYIYVFIYFIRTSLRTFKTQLLL